MAADAVEQVVVPGEEHAGTTVCVVRDELEYVHHTRTMSRVPAPVAMDLVPSLPRLVASRRLVRMRLINRGVGHLLQVRFNVRPEITAFELRPA